MKHLKNLTRTLPAPAARTIDETATDNPVIGIFRAIANLLTSGIAYPNDSFGVLTKQN